MGGALETLAMFEKDCLGEHLAGVAAAQHDQLEGRVARVEENLERLVKLLEVGEQGDQGDDWGEEVETATDLYTTRDIQGDAFTQGRGARGARGNRGDGVRTARHRWVILHWSQ